MKGEGDVLALSHGENSLARGIAALNLGVLRNIVVSWVITLPAGAILAIAIFYVLQACFS